MGVVKSVAEVRFVTRVADARDEREAMEADRAGRKQAKRVAEAAVHYGTDDLPGLVKRLEEEMREAAKSLDFETAARLRDELFDVRAAMDGTRREPRRSPTRR